MAPLLTTGQSRWALHILLAVLSSVAIASSAPSSVGGPPMLHSFAGDVRGVQVMIGSIALGSILVLRTGYVFLPKPWRIYLDRLEFVVFSMLWISWTSATMSFSAFTITEGVCSVSFSETYLPTCPLLTFDLILLHLLSTTSLALCLVILSTALSPSYWLAHSLSTEDGIGKDDPESTDAFVMWDLALASPPSSPRPKVHAGPSTRTGYGTVDSITPLQLSAPSQSGPEHSTSTQIRKDKFAQGRLWLYIPLLMCSVSACIACGFSLRDSPRKYAGAVIFPLVAACISSAFAITFLVRHFMQKRKSVDGETFMKRHDRVLEVACAGMLFLLWPLAAIVVTLFPPTANRPCTNPAESFDSPEEADLPVIEINLLCMQVTLTVAVAWIASWLVLVRVMGLIVPMPEMTSRPVITPTVDRGEEAQSLLRSKPVEPERTERPQVKWGRMVAGEAFELGDEED